jgi:hypothetical protein
MLTITARGRHFQVWADGEMVAAIEDPRAEGADPKKDARITPGAIAFYAPEDEADLDVKDVRIDHFPKVFGHPAPGKKAEPAPAPISAAPAAPAPTPAPAAPAGGSSDAALRALQQQLAEQKAEQAKKEAQGKQEGQLMAQALQTGDPAMQVALFDQILQLNPSNMSAMAGRQEAQKKVDAANQRQRDENDAKIKAEAEEQVKQMNLAQSIESASSGISTGNLAGAITALETAEKIAPNNPQVQMLRSHYQDIQSRRNTIFSLTAGGLSVFLAGALAWIWTLRGKRDPYLLIIEGLDKGRRVNVDKEIVSLGAVPEDGGRKNDLVLRDAERMVSRFHAQIHLKEGKLYVIDTNSSNGTFVDKKRIAAGKPVELKSGSKVSFGGTCTIKVGFEKRSKGKK